MTLDWHDYIRTDPRRLNGQPTVRNMRISVHDVFDYLAGGMSTDEMMEEFPGLTREDIQACFAWAATRAEHPADAQ